MLDVTLNKVVVTRYLDNVCVLICINSVISGELYVIKDTAILLLT